jgi:hypothetical protein
VGSRFLSFLPAVTSKTNLHQKALWYQVLGTRYWPLEKSETRNPKLSAQGADSQLCGSPVSKQIRMTKIQMFKTKSQVAKKNPKSRENVQAVELRQ